MMHLRSVSAALLPLTAVPMLALLLSGCASDRADTAATPPPARAPELSLPSSEEGVMIAVDSPDWSSEVSSVEIPLPTDRDYPPGYWAIIARDLDQTAPIAQPTSSATAPAVAGAPEAPPAATSTPAASLAAAPEAVRAGVLLVPRVVHAGSIHDHPGCYLFAMPLAFQPERGFAAPLRRVSVAVDLSSGSGFGLISIPHIGVFGLRHGPQPMPDGPIAFAFRADQLDALVHMKGTPQRGGWIMDGYDGGPSPTHAVL